MDQHYLKEEDALSSLLFSFGLQQAITNAKERGKDKQRLELNATQQFLVCADGVTLMDENINIAKETQARY
jgi:hypothetical protein